MGYSMGGKVVMLFVCCYLECVEWLVVVDIVLKDYNLVVYWLEFVVMNEFDLWML